MRSQANLDIFRGKWRLYSDHGVATELAWHSYRVLCALATLSLQAALSRCWHCADGVLKMQCRNFPTFLKLWPRACWIWENSICATNFGYVLLAQRPLCAPAKVLLCCIRPYCTAMATIRQPHCVFYSGVCFEQAQSVHHRSAFYAIPQHSLAMPQRCCCGSYCIFLDAVTTLLWWQNYRSIDLMFFENYNMWPLNIYIYMMIYMMNNPGLTVSTL